MCQLLLPLPKEEATRSTFCSAVQLQQQQQQQQNQSTTSTASTPQSPPPPPPPISKVGRRCHPRNYTSKARRSFSWCSTVATIAILVIVSLLTTASTTSAAPSNASATTSLVDDYLDEHSTVLITGMAGFLGSSLAMALHRVYGVKTIVGIDSMDDGFGNTAGTRTPAQLAEFDVRRQRLFQVLQVLGTACHFYRVDVRPNIPDYQDRGEVPVLDAIFAAHPNISHVVHLADPYGMPHLGTEGLPVGRVPLTTQAVPRQKDQIKAGMMESLLEQLIKAGKMHNNRVPHFTYASTSHVYNHYHLEDDTAKNPAPFDEAKPITTPSSLHGASKLIDEIVARTFYETHQLYSVGLRFFDVYGPWSNPGTFLYDLTERAVRQAAAATAGGDDATKGADFVTDADQRILDHAARDYIFIDDAVDALLAAMQFRPATPSSADHTTSTGPPPPVVLNVGTGQQTTARTIVSWVQQFLSMTDNTRLPPPPTAPATGYDNVKRSISYASTERAKEWLGFEARVSLGEGLLQLLAWHHDRIFPYGSTRTTIEDKSSKEGQRRHPMADQGIVSCSPFDAECLKGAPVFPCASECSHTQQCMPSFYDAVLEQTRQWTALCDAVLYTVDLDDDLTALPSATAVVSTTSQSHVVSPSGQHCNLAFVSSNSPLVKQLQQQQQQQRGALKHGFWTLVTVDVPSDHPTEFFLEFLPKLSPGMFFGGTTTKRIIYCDPDVIIDSIPNLLAEAAMQPFHNGQSPTTSKDDDETDHADKKDSEGATKDKPTTYKGATAMLIGKGRQSQSSFRKGDTPIQEAVQETAYRSVRISVIDQMSGDGFALPLDSSFIVHTLQSADSRLFRCDVFAELVQWRVGTDQSAFEFVLELHDMWSRVIVKQTGTDPWWVGESVVTVPEEVSKPEAGPAGSRSGTTQKRRLQEALQDNNEVIDKKVDDAVGETVDAIAPGGAKIVKVVDGAEGTDDDEVAKEEDDKNAAAIDKADTANKGAAFESDEDTVAEDGGAEIIAARINEEDKDDDTNTDDDEEPEDGSVPDQGEVDVKAQVKDMSAYDTWMGVLSSTSMQYFVRIVPSSAAGVVFLDDYDF